MASSSRNVTSGDDPARVAGQLKTLSRELRTALTAIVGYLDLIAADGGAVLREEHLQWIEIIERRVELIGELNQEVAEACAKLRRSAREDQATRLPTENT